MTSSFLSKSPFGSSGIEFLSGAAATPPPPAGATKGFLDCSSTGKAVALDSDTTSRDSHPSLESSSPARLKSTDDRDSEDTLVADNTKGRNEFNEAVFISGT
jgi:hypothetical protein